MREEQYGIPDLQEFHSNPTYYNGRLGRVDKKKRREWFD